MTLSGVTQTIRDGALGIIPGNIDSVVLCIGISKAGTPETLYSFGDPKVAEDTLQAGPLLEAVAFLLDATGGGPVYAVPVTSDVVASHGVVTESKTGDGTITPSGNVEDDIEFKVVITTGGVLGAAKFKYSIDNGRTYSSIISVPGGGTYVARGATLTFACTTGFVANDTYTWESKCKGYSTTKFGDAMDAALEALPEYSLIHVIGRPTDGTGTATLAAAVQTKLDTAAGVFRYCRAIIDCADDADGDLITAFASVEAKRVVVAAGFETLLSSIVNKYMKRPAAWAAMARAASVRPHRHLGAVEDGSLYGVGSLLRDERLTPGLDAERFCTLRTRIGQAGYYIEQPRTMALSTSDFSSLHNGRVMDKACRVAYNALVRYINRDWLLNSAGHIDEAEAKGIEEYVKQALANALLTGSPENRNASAVDFIVSRTDDILATQTLTCKTRVQPKGYSHFIENDLGFTKAFVAAPA